MYIFFSCQISRRRPTIGWDATGQDTVTILVMYYQKATAQGTGRRWANKALFRTMPRTAYVLIIGEGGPCHLARR